MMTSGGGVKYNGSIDCARQIMAKEGFMSMMKGAGANVLRGVAGAGVLAGTGRALGPRHTCSRLAHIAKGVHRLAKAARRV